MSIVLNFLTSYHSSMICVTSLTWSHVMMIGCCDNDSVRESGEGCEGSEGGNVSGGE